MNIKQYQRIIESTATADSKDGKLIPAARLNEVINVDPVLGDPSINWEEWNYFIHDTIFCPLVDVFYADRLLLVGVILCEGSDSERAEVLWSILQTKEQT